MRPRTYFYTDAGEVFLNRHGNYVLDEGVVEARRLFEVGEEAQFQLPKHKAQMYRQKGLGDPPSPLTKFLSLEYSYGSESAIDYRENSDLDGSLKDDFLIATPELNAFVRYRPTSWLEATLEMIFDREIDIIEEDFVILPDGEIQFAPDRRFSLLVDQLNVTIKQVIAPFRFTIGRLNFEDERHWLYDTSIDVAKLVYKQGKFNTEVWVGRENLVDLEAIKENKPDRITTSMILTEYRGIEDIKFAGYIVYREDHDRQEGQPLHLGLRSIGNPTINLSYWAEFAYLVGQDQLHRDFQAYGFDFGATYRFRGLPLNPNATLAVAYATGDDNPNDNENNEFRQTGLQSNEAKFGGVSEFLIYGEALDPELSNIRILTAGVGIRPIHGISFDVVYHNYRLDKVGEEIRNTPLTAKLNQNGVVSKDVGSALDLVLGMRSLFGVKRLGLDLRGGWFFPGGAFPKEGAPFDFKDADKGVSFVGKFWW
ncbi:MAG: hypothetical protein NPINA01_08040 [Nitrospinaceae bacterium]|nr:MAG: hypothetical protein NPINA01_08040 [Nitrospinaceae bacterium]